MQLVGKKLMFSAGDLATHLGCRHKTALDLEVVHGKRVAPPLFPDPILDLLRKRGLEHEDAYVKSLGTTDVVRIVALGGDDAAKETLAAMRRGTEVIVQGTVMVGCWTGRPDVLRRAERKDKFGAWEYQVIDTKLSTETRAGTILQLCLYNDLVGQLQGTRSEVFHVVSPGAHGFARETFRMAEFEAYYKHVKDRLERWKPGATYPDPVEHCDFCRWWQVCDKSRRDDDSLWLVAGVTRMQKRDLGDAGIKTLAQLASARKLSRSEHCSAESLALAQLQAKMQLQERQKGKPQHEMLPVEEGRGLCRLPASSPGDVFFDIEGDRMGVAKGREFLFGLFFADEKGVFHYRPIWATTDAEERLAFEQVLDFFGERLKRWPECHIYHYAPYEPSALKRLMGHYGTREDALDELLRRERFVDLYRIVRQALRAGVERYSIKNLEPFYGFVRKANLRAAGACVRAVALALGADEAIDEQTRHGVEDYNREDCESTRELRDWLEELRRAFLPGGTPIPRPVAKSGAVSEKFDEKAKATQAVMDALLVGLPAELSSRDDPQQGRWLLAHLLAYHRRERKVFWWERYRLLALDAEEALDERMALGGLTFERTVATSKQGIPTDRYLFPDQVAQLKVESGLLVPDSTGKKLTFGEVVLIDLRRRCVDIKKTKKTAGLHPQLVFSHDDIDPGEKPEALLRLAAAICQPRSLRNGVHAAAGALLDREKPRVALAPKPGESRSDMACRVVLQLDGEVLPIQGPPGTGKTYLAARMIVALVKAGKKVGVTAVSHKVIRKVLEEVVAAAAAANVSVSCIENGGLAGGNSPIQMVGHKEVAAALANGQAQVAGGTSWLWSRAALAGAVDVLFVDEAGQMSLADTLCVAQAGGSMVLVGDPRQLDQPQQGSHPEGTELSALEHLLGGRDTVAEGAGLFLGETWRMAPEINRLTSELFYEGRLTTRKGLEKQVLAGTKSFDGAGLWYVPVEHEGNTNASKEEAAAVVRIVDDLLRKGAEWINRDGEGAPLRGEDILVVAPYNAHVDLLEAAVRDRGPRVGTVDKFQGQEAPVVIYSTATSTPEDAPRGMEFLYSPNRFNVATSRARCTCILVASPRLFEPECRSPRQMKLANVFCWYQQNAQLTHV